jgi:hypothetical protein
MARAIAPFCSAAAKNSNFQYAGLLKYCATGLAIGESKLQDSWNRSQMKRGSTSMFWIGMAFAVALGLAAVVLAIEGIETKGIVRALQITARWSFLLFWLAYSAGAMCELFGPALAPFARHGRELGLSYAAAQLIHLGLVVWLFQISTRPPLSGGLFAFFVIAIVWTYSLAAVSFGGLAEALGTRSWRTVPCGS